MATKVIEKMLFCKQCNKETLHRKNSKQMSWIMHLVLTILTAGGWLIFLAILFIWHTINKSATAITNSWVCAECGTKH
jgi:hypothetical protein